MKITKHWSLEEPKEYRKPIEFMECLNERSGQFEPSTNAPNEFDNIELLYHYEGFDYMLAWDPKCIYRGHWNSGTV